MFEIKAQKRDLKEDLNSQRKAGNIPAVFYGFGNASTSVFVSLNEFKKIWKKAGESSAVKLNFSGKVLDVLIHDVALNSITNEPIHVDFLVIDANKEVVVSIPLVFTGVSPAVKSGLGVLVKVLHEIEVKALPKDLPHSISIDISSLVDLDHVITVADLPMLKNVTFVTKSGEIVASISEQKEEVASETVVDLSKIEVEKKGKKETEEEQA